MQGEPHPCGCWTDDRGCIGACRQRPGFMTWSAPAPPRPIHVFPLDREHDITGAPCWCAPVTTADGVVVHRGPADPVDE